MNAIRSIALPAVVLVSFVACQYQAGGRQPTTSVQYEDLFENGLDTSLWISEIAPVPGSRVYVADGKLWLDTYGGVTVWLNLLLEGNIAIEYDRTVVVDSGKNDRLSDLNQFWMATDPSGDELFSRSGIFESYDSLSLYYVGMGGNTNTTTRFRKYEGDGTKPLLYERNDHLLEANRTYHIRTEVKDGTTTFSVDGQILFTHTDPSPLTGGYFGFRSTHSRQSIDNFKVYRLD